MKIKKVFLGASLLACAFVVASCASKKPAKTGDKPGETTIIPSTGETPISTGGVPVSTSTDITPTTTTVDPVVTYPATDESNITESKPGSVITKGEVNVKESYGKYESAYFTFDNVSDATSYNIYVDGKKVDEKIAYVQNFNTYSRADLFGLTKGEHEIEIAAVKSGAESNGVKTKLSVDVSEYDRSGYAHFNYDEGVGAYNNDGTIKENAIILYVTDDNKNTVELSYKGKTVKGIGNILNSTGQASGDLDHETECKKVSNGKTYYGKGNTNQGILLDLALDNIPLIVRFVGCVSNTGLKAPGTFDASKAPLIEGLTYYDSVDCGGSEGDNGHMARMKSAKNITFEGVGSEATIDGFGFHLICETAHKDLAKNFEVRNLAFINTPEDAIGMEGQQQDSTLTITASVERCWVHHNTFISPKISNPAEGDKSEGDGSCDFKRGRYFTCSYNYFEDCHKTNLVGSGKTSLQYNMSYHHNIWYNCAARQPLARRGNIHFYNNLIIGTTDTVSSLRADSYMYAEYNYYLGCSRPVEYKAEGTTGICKSFNNTLVGCLNNYDATVATTRNQEVASNCKDTGANVNYVNFDSNSSLFYYDSTRNRSDCYLTTAEQARLDCIISSGSAYRTEAKKCKLGFDNNITDVQSSETISGNKELTLAKAKNVIKVFTVTSPVTITIAATSSASNALDTGYLLKMDGTLVLALSSTEKTAVLENGVYVIASSICFTGNNGKNNKETTVTKCIFEEYNSEELEKKLIANYNTSVSLIPSNIEFNDASYNAIKNAIDAYNVLGDLKNQVTNYNVVTTAFNQYKTKGVAIVENAINAIGTVDKNSGALISAAREIYNVLSSRVSNVVVSNYNTLVAAETAFETFALDAFNDAVAAIGNVTYTDAVKEKIDLASELYENLNEEQRDQVSQAYATLAAAINKYNVLGKASNVITLINDVDLTSSSSMKEVIVAFDALTDEEKAYVTNASNMDSIRVSYVIVLIDAIGTVTSGSEKVITTARVAYDSLPSNLKTQITNYETLTEAETEFDKLVFKYDIVYDASTETISAKTGTTSAGYSYSSGEKTYMKIKNSLYITLDNIGVSTVTIVIKSNILDTSSQLNGCFVITFEDGTTTDLTFLSAANKAESTETLNYSSDKVIKSISFVGSKESTKNYKVSYLSISYKK